MAGERSKKEMVMFNQKIVAGANYSGVTALKQLLRAPCTIQQIFVKFNPGQQGDLHIRPYLKMTDERDEELVTYPPGGNHYLSGDNIELKFGIDFDAAYGYNLCLDVQNVSIYDYTLLIAFEVDYVGGASRVI